jgi:CBS domain containing-hemolysin-like protein
MKYVAFGDFFGGEVSNEETRAHGELVPLPLCHKLPLLIQKLLISSIHLGWPPLILIVWCFAALSRLLLSKTGRGGKVVLLRMQGL